MNIRILSVLSLLSSVLCVSASAENISLSRQQSYDLFAALSRLDGNLNASNAIAVADNIIELRPVVEALEKGKVAAQRQVKKLPGVSINPNTGSFVYASPEAEAAAQAIVDVLEARAAEVIKLDLTRLDITAEEITAAKIPPAQLAVIRQWLKPKAK